MKSSTIRAVADDLIPTDHPIGTKRICTDTGYYETFNRDNVAWSTCAANRSTAITVDAVRTSAATYPCDALVFATGFDAMTGALTRIDPVGPAGDRLSDLWADGPVTFLGLMVPRLPNLFSLSGPGSPSVLANMVLHAEVQVDWVVELIATATAERHRRGRGRDSTRPRPGPTTSPRSPRRRCSPRLSRRGTWAPTSRARSGSSCHTWAGSACTGRTVTTWPSAATQAWCSRRDETGTPKGPRATRSS